MHILVVDDDYQVCDLIAVYAQGIGWQVDIAPTGVKGLEMVRSHTPDVVVLDLMLPDMSGWEVLDAIRAHSKVYILVLSARSGEPDRIQGLRRGADDYLVKPFSPGELLARCEALLRRPRTAHIVEDAMLRFEHLTITPDRHLVEVDGVEKQLTASEFSLLLAMARHPQRVFTRGQLVEVLWGDIYEGYDRVIDVHIGHIRKKLGGHPDAPSFIETVRGVGYRFVERQT